MFTEGSVKFLETLKANNNRDWFADNKAVYEREIKNPARVFADIMAGEFEALTGRPHKFKIFRIYRDVRFSKDKTPYNTYQRISWMPGGAGANAPGWFFSLETDHVVIGTGVFQFDKSGIEHWRELIDGRKGDALAKILARMQKSGIRMSEPDLKRVPSGFDKDHRREVLLRHKGLAVWVDYPDAKIITDGNFAKNFMTDFKRLRSVYDWLLAAS